VSVHKIRTAGGEERWIVRWTEGGRGGRQRRRTFHNAKDAERCDVAIKRAKHLGHLAAEVMGSEQTFSEFADEWLEKYGNVYLRRGTLISYAHVIDKWLLPYLGRLRMRDLSSEAIAEWAGAMQRDGAGAPTVNRALGILQGILRRAVEWRRIPFNPVAGTPRIAHVRSASIDAHTPEDIELIRSGLIRKQAALVSILAYEGLRTGEAFALEWHDALDGRGRPRDRLLVRRAISGDRIGPPKNGRGREPELFAPVARELAELYLAIVRPKLETTIFAGAKGALEHRQNWRQRTWIPALAKAWPCPPCSGTGKVGLSADGDVASRAPARAPRPTSDPTTCAIRPRPC